MILREGGGTMQIVIVHYHLRRGGVTRVIETAIEALAGKGFEILVLSGDEAVDEKAIPNVRVVSDLNYRNSGTAAEADALANELQSVACGFFGRAPVAWHFHNPALGKNVLMPPVVSRIAESAPVFLQTHDFAEDGRPENFRRQTGVPGPLWPQGRQVHHGTINARDFSILAAAGVENSQLHLIPNAVSKIKTDTNPEDRPFAQGKRFFLYPTRAIRRKNVGELLLHAHFHRDDAEFATTLAPENPEWLAILRHWEKVAADLKLPVQLGNHGHGFADLIGWSDGLITTSIAEGFGLAFLEPWLAGKSIVGRDLPEITADFSLDLGHLYSRFDVPVDRIDLGKLRAELDAELENSYAAYGRECPENAVGTALDSMIRDGQIDFGRLSEPFQTAVIENPEGVEPPSIEPCPFDTISEQTGLVRKSYSVDSYGEKLGAIYEAVASSPIGEISDPGPDLLLDSFLDPARFNLLRT
ncbi:MAG: glycosyltransferase family 4 protein [Verrucomicrobiales bacterium]|nr:glycosyltransferase family 4 protein [Verrucomicrobiales bacterium]